MTTATFKTLRAQNLPVGRYVVAQVWMTRSRRVQKLVKVLGVTGRMVKVGMTVTTDAFTATSHDGILMTEVNGKMHRVTFGLLHGMMTQLALPAPVKPVAQTTKRVRKPLTDVQKARKNALARARRVAKKAQMA